jgi:hypothetical protein
VGEPFALRGREKYYRAINYRDLLIAVSLSGTALREHRLTSG